MKKYFGWIVLLVVIAGMVFLLFKNKNQKEEQSSATIISMTAEVPVEVLLLKNENYQLPFSSNGVLQAQHELNFVSDVSGRVVEIFADKGKHVKAGESLLKIDTELLEADYTANLASYNALKKDAQRFERSNQAGGVTNQQLDNIRTQLIAAESRMKVSKKRLEDAMVKSPMDGTVNMRYVEIGSLIAPNVPLFDIVDDRCLKVVCNVSETKVTQLSEGQQVVIGCNNYPEERFGGTIRYVGIKTDRGLNYPIEIEVDRNDHLLVGMYVKVNFFSEQTRHGILVPRKAIIGSVKSANVFVMEDGKAVKKAVVMGDMLGDRVEIIRGLKENDSLIVSGIMNVADGTAVRAINDVAL